MDPSFALTAAFAVFLVASLLVKFWLASRQVRHVSRHRDTVPPPFEGIVPLPAHQKAADYTIAKGRIGILETAFGGAVLVAWTLLGGLDALNQVLVSWLAAGMWQQLALLASVSVIGGLLDLPFSLYQTFVIEQRFGFNK
ncbi:MAG TPA: M48 family metallopeptidase, partial [Ramlibacter sp.]|nr:M48 family metallopeptidase [Ramlibacter sp.]